MRKRQFARIVDLPQATLQSGIRPRLVANRNDLVARFPFVKGVKTGHTLQAGYVLVGAGEKKGARVISVTLGAPSEAARDADTLALLRWGLAQFRSRIVVKAGRPLAHVHVDYRDEDADLGAPRDVRLVLRKGERTSTVLDGVPGSLEGPVDRGERVGWVNVRRQGKTVRRVPLVTLARIEEAGFLRRLTSGIGGLFLTALALLGMVASAILIVRSRGRTR
jgi:D-alanyl-D-alanine carboxypeptidase (penicillin-binding protein 5/6)